MRDRDPQRADPWSRATRASPRLGVRPLESRTLKGSDPFRLPNLKGSGPFTFLYIAAHADALHRPALRARGDRRERRRRAARAGGADAGRRRGPPRRAWGGAPEPAAAPADTPQRTISDAANGTALPGLEKLRDEGVRRPATPRPTRPTTGSARPTSSTRRSSAATRSTARACRCSPSSTTAATTTTPSGTAARWSSATATASSSTASRSPLDVIGHELTHGVTEHEAGLDYQDQSGALNESISDVFGSLVKQHQLGQTAAEADWLIGAGSRRPRATAARCAR